MRIANLGRLGLVLVLGTSLSGCLGSSSGGGGGGAGGGGGGGGGGSSFDTEFDRVTAKAPTSNMPTEINASYAGRLKVDVTDPTTTIGEVEGDLNLDVAWRDGQTTNPFSGTASGFTGTLVTGETGAIDGTLTVDDSFGGSISRVVNPAMEVAGVSVPETQVGALTVTLTGELSQGGTTADTNIMLGGSFFGDAGEAALGPVVGGYNLPDSANPAIFDGAIAGTYYIEQE
ncbi:hypothetical protein JYP51_05100 [Ponticoccus gilvus]|nr:hypothetical protein [Enemella evansiae]